MFNSDQKRAFVAVLLSGVVLFSWQYFFASKLENKAPANVSTQENQPTQKSADNGSSPTKLLNKPTDLPVSLQNFSLKSSISDFTFSNDLTFLNTTSDGSLIDLNSLSGSKKSFKLQLLSDNGPIDLILQPTIQTATNFSGTNINYGIAFESSIDELGKLNFKIHSEKAYKFRLSFNGVESKLDNGQQRQFLTYSKDVTFLKINKDKEVDGTYKWMGIDFNYHLFAVSFKDAEVGKVKTTENGNMYFDLTNAKKDLQGSIVFTKKNYDHLISLGDNLHLSVDFGFFAILAVPILRGLQFIYKYIPNYGLAIILLTIFLRLITFPLQYKSFKSMKKMQSIQPELQKIKEKYKDDAPKMQKETMALFSKAGANPLSGCLPLLLQMPFFFAIYRVLYSAVELVGAPFFGWIHDLSIHDPFYVLPVLMAGSMFLQQKITPQTSVDPNQQKIMMFMPLIFGFIMKNLPAGLVLYIFVSTIVGILQQYMVYRSVD